MKTDCLSIAVAALAAIGACGSVTTTDKTEESKTSDTTSADFKAEFKRYFSKPHTEESFQSLLRSAKIFHERTLALEALSAHGSRSVRFEEVKAVVDGATFSDATEMLQMDLTYKNPAVSRLVLGRYIDMLADQPNACKLLETMKPSMYQDRENADKRLRLLASLDCPF